MPASLRSLALPSSIALLALALASPASAAPVPRYSELPFGHVTAPNEAPPAPRSVTPGETAPGFRLVSLSPSATMSVTSSASSDVPKHVGDAACFARATPAVPSNSSTDVSFPEWRPFSWKIDVLATPLVMLVHSERVVDDGRATSLESVDAWVDTKTHGIRVAARATLPLRQIATAPGGVRVFAARDERAGGQHLVQFVVTHPKDAPADPFLNTMVAQGAGPLTWFGACGHHRVAVPVTREGDTATLQLATILPDLAPGERSAAMPLPPAPPGVPSKDVRVRNIRAQFSVSQTSRDAEPVVAVSMAWAGPEAFQRLSTHVPPPVVRPQPRPVSKPATAMVSTSR